MRHRFPGGGVGTPRGHSIITTLADHPYYSNCFEFPGFQTCLFQMPGKGQKYSEIAARQRMCGCAALVFLLFVGSERHNHLEFETRGGCFQGPGKLYSSNIFIKEPIWSKEVHTLTSTSSDGGLPSLVGGTLYQQMRSTAFLYFLQAAKCLCRDKAHMQVSRLPLQVRRRRWIWD